jgi:beta-phosphoglucomutase-like phosphatase (HAD superfamily)
MMVSIGHRFVRAAGEHRCDVEELGLRVCFDAVVSGDDLPGKAQPTLFSTVARLLGVLPERCVVVEDAITGADGARRAGMKCIAVTTTNPAALGQADIVADRLDALPMDVLQRLPVEAWCS